MTEVSQARKIVGDSGGNRAENDFYPTPKNATLALLEKENFSGLVWECACGKGDMSRVLVEDGHLYVVSTDKYDYGFGYPRYDFLTSTYPLGHNIITNPPYNLANEFVIHAMKDLKINKLALLLKLTFLEGLERREKIFNIYPPIRIHIFSKRLTIFKNGIETKNSGMITFAWFIWEKGNENLPILDWI